MKWIKYLTFSLQNLKIRKKLIGTYIIVVLIPILMVGFILTNGMKNMAIEQAINEANTNTDRIQIRLNEVLSRVTEVSDRIYSDSDFDYILSNQYSVRWDIVKSYLNFGKFIDLKRSYPEIKSFRIYAYNQTLLNNWEFIPDITEIVDKEWYQKVLKKNGEIVWQYIWNELYSRESLSLTRLIKDEYNKKLAVMVIELDSSYLHSIIAEEPFLTAIEVEDGLVACSNNPSLVGIGEKNEEFGFIEGYAHNVIRETTLHDEPSKVIINSFKPQKSGSDINIFTMVPIKSITKRSNEVGRLGFGIMGISFVISLVLLIFFSHVLSSRFIKVRSEMHKVVQGNYEISTDLKGMDEIGELHADLKAMVNSFKQLIYEVYEERLLKEQLKSRQKEIQFQMLANQINPHFLYNVLETIRMKAHSNGETEIAGVVKMLARIMRRNLEATNRTVTLASEIELVSNYLEIQKFRYEDKVNYKICIETNIDGYYVLPLLLQPIVENAFIHGLECRRKQGMIRIFIKNTVDFLEISIEDNGAGINKEKMEEISRILADSEADMETSIGLKNVQGRVRLYYGSKFGLDISSRPGDGTKVILRLPSKEALRHV